MAAVCFVGTAFFPAFRLCGQKIELYKPIPASAINVESSSSFKGFPEEETINNSGMIGHGHISHNLGKTMWTSESDGVTWKTLKDAIVSDNSAPYQSLFSVSGNNKIAVSTIRPSKDRKGYLVRLVNLSPQPVHSSFVWGAIKAANVLDCDGAEQDAKSGGNSFWMKPYGTTAWKVE